ncbi:hypothetical protein BDR06DRAFT_1014141 [Suillus hirtellus]|nr:hypothetical protein BDR06DRAFT_1014141 [Suillus hirtellus]
MTKILQSAQHACVPLIISHLLSPVSRLLSPVSRLPSPVSRLPSPVSRLPSPVSCLPSPVSRLPSPVSRLPFSQFPIFLSSHSPVFESLSGLFLPFVIFS